MSYFNILHRTYYNFSNSVSLGEHKFHLRPRENYEVHIKSYELKIIPAPQKLLWHRDVEGNSVAIATFDVPVTQLSIENNVVIQQLNNTPLDFLVSDYAVNYPFSYNRNDHVVLSPYMALPDKESVNLLQQWVTNFWQETEQIQTYTLLERLGRYIHDNLIYKVREEEGVQSVTETLSNGTGSCRDFATLFMQTARYLGLASRFVSGYLYVPDITDDSGATHAWAEVYLPGAGWKGFDPTIGEIVGTDHIAVAVARLPESVPPVSGTFTGNATSSLTVGVWLHTNDPEQVMSSGSQNQDLY